MKVMYTCDNNYVWLMGISTISLFENNRRIPDLKVYLLGENISANNKEKLNRIAKEFDREIEIIDVPNFNIPPSLVSARWPRSAYTRLFSGRILPKEINRILYLDCDTIILKDISELEEIQFDEYIALGVKDCISGTYKKNIGLDRNSPYINAGVILFNIDALRKIDINTEIEQYMKKYEKLINYADQDILNAVFSGKIGELNPNYNVMTIDVSHTYEEILKLRKPTNFYNKEEIESAKKNPIIIHYTANMLIIRPWFSNSNHPFADNFNRIKDKSVWKDRKMLIEKFDSKEARIIKIIMMMPKRIAYSVLGLIHSEIKPKFKKIKASKC